MFSILTWNVENFTKPGEDADAEAQDLFAQKRDLLAEVIQRDAPDVIAFQEILKTEALEALRDTLGGAWPHLAISTLPDQRGIRVAFLSKLPILEQEDRADFPPGPALNVQNLTLDGAGEPLTRMGRGALRIQVDPGDGPIDCLTLHLKSKLLSYPPFPGQGSRFNPRDEDERAQAGGVALHRRAAEAVTVRLWVNSILEAHAERPVIVLGDLNDVPEAQTSMLLNGPPGSEIGTGGFHPRDRGDPQRLFNLAPLIPETERFSRVFRGRGELLDQILASEECLPRQDDGKRAVPEVRSRVDFAHRRIASVSEDPSDRREEVAPDHSPVLARFPFLGA
ncbi:MAG: endonuclease/exonuclease/phosphatase family protein [Opitutales bacterium]